MKSWYCLCILFCVYCISLLLEERYEVSYRLEDQNKTNAIYYVACFNLNVLKGFANKTKFDFNQLKVELLDYFDSHLPNITGSDQLDREQADLFNRTFLVKIQSRNYTIFNNQFCFAIENYASYLLLRHYDRPFGKDIVYLAAERISENFLLLKTKHAVGSLLLVINQPYPYSNCKEDYSKVYCLDNCYKRRLRLSSYFYRAASGDTRPIYFDNGEKNQTVLEHERSCWEECHWEDCRVTYLSMVNNREASQCKLIVFRAFPKIEDDHFWFQLIGLICFFSNKPLYGMLSKLILLADSKIKRKTKALKVVFLCLQRAAFLCIFGCCILLFWLIIVHHVDELDSPPKNPPKFFTFAPETLQIVICVNINRILGRCYEPNCLQESLYANRTLQQLEAETNVGYNDTVQGVYLTFMDRKMSVDFSLSNKTIFRDGQRCYQLIVKPTEPKYQQLVAISKLQVELKHPQHSSYLLLSDEVFSTNSSEYRIGYHFAKHEIIRSRSKWTEKCIDYGQAHSNPLCFNRFNCIQRCLGRRFIAKYQNVSLWSIVQKEHFNESEWNDSYLIDDGDSSKRVLNECKKQFPDAQGCQEVYFVGSPAIVRQLNAGDSKKIRINLYYFNRGYIEQEPSPFRPFFELLNVQGVLFGLTVLSPLRAVRTAVGLKCKTSLVLIYLVCLTGFTAHLYVLFDLIINGELTSSQTYEQSEYVDMPELTFCLKIPNLADIDKRQLTGRHLDEMTRQLNVKAVFTEIAYLNESNSWIGLKSPKFFQDKNLKTEAFYFAKMKCFSLFVQMSYRRNQFFFANNSQVLRIDFNRTMIHRAKQMIYFFTKKPYSLQLHRIVAFDFDEALNTSYYIKQGFFEYVIADRFELLRNPLLLFRKETSVNDVDEYMTNLLKGFEKSHNRTTLRLPLVNVPVETNSGPNNLTTFDLAINDSLFEEFYQIRNEAEQNVVASLNFRRHFVFNQLSKQTIEDLDGQESNDSDLEFSLSFFKGVFCFTNSENYIKLIINLLNVLLLYFDVGVLELHGFKSYLIFVIKFFVRKLSGKL